MSSQGPDRNWFWEAMRQLAWVALAALLTTLAVVPLRRIGPYWGDVSYFVVALGTILVMQRQGLMRGQGFNAGNVSLFANYRKRSMLLFLLVGFAGTLLVGAWPLARPVLDPGKANNQLIWLFFLPATLPFEAANWWLARQVGDRPTLRRALALWLPALLVAEVACWILLVAIDHRHPGVLRPLHYIVGLGTGPSFLLMYLSRHHTTLKWHSHVDEANERVAAADTARQLAEARLAVLQAQIEPHFLFNTLATVEYLVKSDPAMAGVLLNQLTRYLRLAMPSMRQLSSTLGREFELTDAYLQIAKLRMGGRLAVDMELPDALLTVGFPPLVVQTLVENAIKHGVEPKPGPVRIRVFARQVGSELHVGVQDNGMGLRGVTAPEGGTGVQNIRERLKSLHGDRAQLSIAGLADGGVQATVVLPVDKP
jgi:hypothetical protein